MTFSDVLSSTSKVLVTGGTGFIGAHCVGLLLERDFHVKVASRSLSKFEKLKSSLPQSKQSLLTCFVQTDVTDFDEVIEAVRGCDAVLHLASPFTDKVSNLEKELMRPAVLGTQNILRASAKEERVKRIVVTSSIAAAYDSTKGSQPNLVLTEKDFSPLLWEHGVTTKDPALAYRASKAVAEKTAWNFMNTENPSFDIVVLCPTMVFGPFYLSGILTSVNDLNFSNKVVWELLESDSVDSVIPPTKGPLWVDVRDLALAHILALLKPSASNQRYLISAGDYDNQEIADILRSSLDSKWSTKVPIGSPGSRLTGTHFKVNSSKACKELGIKFRSLESSVLDLSHQLLSL